MSRNMYIAEGVSLYRPPYFDDTGMWRVITDGDFIPRVNQNDSTSTEKKEANWTTDEKSKVLLNSKAHLFLSCALSREESERVDECKTAKEVWDTLQTHHEGTSHVKETRIDIGIRKFELFEMNEGETIDEMYSRFTTIVNELRSLGKAYTVQERVRKIMRCLPIIWRPMVTAISQAKAPKKFPFKKNSMMANWDDYDETETEEPEEASLCLMADTKDKEEINSEPYHSDLGLGISRLSVPAILGWGPYK
uniref:Uncharacterized protein LOC113787736 n=1 Tax=Cicer arietinum TaxID=3827 RepID=A0A3Q7YDW5_CICAR|nr:uncharacterized protein LOC113787736 [Cicer arietinum]